MIERQPGSVSLAQYLAFEEASLTAHEYRNGTIVAMSEASGAHEQIKNNLVAYLLPATKKTGYRLFSGGVKLICPNDERTIPDFGITCDSRDFLSLDRMGEARIQHPWLIVEILSPSTEKDDRGNKLDTYNLVRSLTHYVLIDSRRQWMLLHQRTVDGLLAIHGPLERFLLPTLGELTLEIVYDATSVTRIN